MFMKRELCKEGYMAMRMAIHRGKSHGAIGEAFLGEGASQLGSKVLLEARS